MYVYNGVQRYDLWLLSIKIIITIQLTLFTCKKMPLYKSHYMADVVVFRAKRPFYIVWRPDL